MSKDDDLILRDDNGKFLSLEPTLEAHYFDPNNPTSIIWYWEY